MEIILYAILSFFAVYGMYEIIYRLAMFKCNSGQKAAFLSHKVLFVNNRTINIEDYVRNELIKEEEDKLILIDDSSEDEIKVLLQKIKDEFSLVDVMTREEYSLYINALY